MRKRAVIFNDYDTAYHQWTLSACEFPEPAPDTNLVAVPGRVKGPLDFSTVLTDGEPTYGSRSLNITLESSEGDRLDREARIRYLVNKLHGRRVEQIILPDDPLHYVAGRLTVKRKYNDLAHGSVEVTGTCEPWRYSIDETIVQLEATTTEQTVTLTNDGTMPVLPTLAITAGEGESVRLTFGAASITLTAGVYEWPDFWLTAGDHDLTYSGAGSLSITYREAVL